MAYTRFLPLLGSLVFLVGCGGSVSLVGFDRELAQARISWSGQKLRSYQFTIRRGCFCPPPYTDPVTITVRDGVAIDAPEQLASVSTVDKVLDLIEAEHKTNPAVLNVTYSSQGWPTAIYVDRSKELADEEYSLTLTDLRPL